jgi:hypothetical protein
MDYSAGEVAMFLAITDPRDAIDTPQSGLTAPDGGGGGEGDRIPFFARWSEVHRAKRRVIARRSLAIDRERAQLVAVEAQLVARGYTGDEVASIMSTSQQSVSRHSRSMIDSILHELGCSAASANAPGRVAA